jgi:N-acetylglucosaminyldiphosphoundecaprenol N-acetyl-beta-D-mannosaminyltransferase
MNPPTVPVLGTPLAVTDYAAAVDLAKSWAGAGDAPHLIAAANTHLVTLARRDAEFRRAIDRFDLVLPDGMPLVWAMNRRLAEPLRDRVYGPTFMLRCLEATQGGPWSHLFIGGSPQTLDALRAKLLARFPALRIVGMDSPAFGEWPAAEHERILALIRDAGAQFVWIGLGCPKQELWLARHRDRLPPAVYGAVGAAFAFHAGLVRQAPPWMQSAGLEWLFRLCAEPRRLWRRYFVFNSLFVWYLLRDLLRRQELTP